MSGQGQGIIGHECEWCGKPAVDNVLISPATHRVDRRGARDMVHTAQYAWVCDDHTHLALDPEAPPSIRNFRRRKATGYEQPDLFGGEAA